MGKQRDKAERAFATERPYYRAMMDAAREILGEAYVDHVTRTAPNGEDVGELLLAIQTSLPEPVARKQLANRAAALFPKAPTEPAQTALLSDGLLRLPPLLEGRQVEELRDDLLSKTNFDVEDKLEKHKVADLVAAPHLLSLATHPSLLAVASGFLGCVPTVVNIEGWWSAPTAHVYGPEMLHRDKDDFRACKFFMYLTDVGEEDGPHEYAVGSTDLARIRELLAAQGRPPETLRDIFTTVKTTSFAAMNEEIFAASLVRITGEAGTCFVTNSSGLHRGVPPIKGRRGIIAITFGFIGYPNRIYRFAPAAIEPPEDASARHALRLLS